MPNLQSVLKSEIPSTSTQAKGRPKYPHPEVLQRLQKAPTKSLTFHSLTLLTSKIQARFPLEIRRSIYGYVFDEKTTREVALFAQPSLDDYPIFYSMLSQSERPKFIHPAIIPPSVLREMFLVYLEKFPDFTVANPGAIGPFLNEDFFNSGARPRDAILSTFTVRANLMPNSPDSFTARNLHLQFAPLIAPSQVWSRNCLKLTIILETQRHFDAMGARIVQFFRAMKTIIKTARDRGAEVKVVVRTGLYEDNHALKHLNDSKNMWDQRCERICTGYGFPRRKHFKKQITMSNH